jgi:cyanophycin synthetase
VTFRQRLAGAHVLVTGAGVTGPPVAKALLALGAVVTVTDADAGRLRSVAQSLPGLRAVHDLRTPPPDTALVVTAPGWRPDAPVLAAAARAGIEVIGDVELAWRLCAEQAEPPVWLAVTGTNGKTTTVRMLAHVTKMGGYTPGLTTTDGVYIDGQRTVQGDMTGPISARMVLADPQIDMAILETARGGLLRAGMGVREVNVGAVLNVQSDHLGLKGIDTLEQLSELKRIVVEVATDCAVLNADDPLVLKMSGYTEAKNICYVTMNPQHTLVREHIRAGGRACALEAGVNGQMITLYDRGGHIPLLWTHLIPATLEGRATHNVQNAMFAAAMAFSLGIKLDAIRQGLRTFDSTFYQAPGRMNVFNEHPFKVLFDYGHNAHAVGMMADLAQRLDVIGRRLVVLAGPGDRRDEDLVAIANAVAGRFDHYVCRRDDNLRDRAPDEVPRIQAQALRAAGVPESAISIIPDEQEAIETVLRMGETGDLLLIFADALVRSWKQITKFKPSAAALPQSASRSAPTPARPPASAIEAKADETRFGPGRDLGAPVTEASATDFNLEGLIRDERGVRMAPESDD